MKKPAVVLVDHRTTLRDAVARHLEAETRHLVHVEKAASVVEAIECLDACATSGRPVALAAISANFEVRDQAQLVRKVAATGRVLGAQTIVLAERESLGEALAAKNQAGASRYVAGRQPREIVREIVHALGPTLTAEGPSRFYTCRELITEDEFVAAWRLRYQVYRETELATLLPADGTEVDVDAHDLRSILLGLFQSEKLVATIRIVVGREQPQANVMRAAIERCGLGHRTRKSPTQRFPFLEYVDDVNAAARFVERLERDGGRAVEIGRHAMLPSHRRGNTDRKLLDATAAFLAERGYGYVLAWIPPSHMGHYRPLGFERVEGIAETTRGFPGIVIWSKHEKASAERSRAHRALEARLRGFSDRALQSLCTCRTYPECVPEPYRSGVVGEKNILCPRELRRELDSHPDALSQDGNLCAAPRASDA